MGRGVPTDFVTAYMWLDLAATAGHHGAEQKQEFIAAGMTRDSIARAQQLGREQNRRKNAATP